MQEKSYWILLKISVDILTQIKTWLSDPRLKEIPQFEKWIAELAIALNQVFKRPDYSSVLEEICRSNDIGIGSNVFSFDQFKLKSEMHAIPLSPRS